MESRVKSLVIAGEMAKLPESNLCRDLCAFLSLQPVFCPEIAELSKLNVAIPVLYLSAQKDWEQARDKWPKADGVTTYIGLITNEFPTSEDIQKFLKNEISFLVSEKISFDNQREAFEDLLL